MLDVLAGIFILAIIVCVVVGIFKVMFWVICAGLILLLLFSIWIGIRDFWNEVIK